MFTLAHLSDWHLASRPALSELIGKRGLGYINWHRGRKKIHRPDVLDATIHDLKAAAPDHIAVTGDLVNLSLPDEYNRARGWLQTLGSPRDVTLVPGNHDIYVRRVQQAPAKYWADYMRGDDGLDRFPFVRRRGNVALIGLSTALPTAPLLAQRDEPQQKSEHERTERAPAPPAALAFGFAARDAQNQFGILVERTLAFDQAARNIGGDCGNDLRNLVRLREHMTADLRILVQETVNALVAPHGDMSDGIDPQPRGVAAAYAAVEQLDLRRDVGKQRIKRLVQEFEPRDLGVAQIDDDAGTLGRLDARLVHRLLQRRARLGVACRRGGFTLSAPHTPSVPLGEQYTGGRGRRKRPVKCMRNAAAPSALWPIKGQIMADSAQHGTAGEIQIVS